MQADIKYPPASPRKFYLFRYQSDGVFEDEERVIIKKIMKRIGVADDHPYFEDNNLDVPTVRANVGKILNSIKTFAPKP